MVIDIVCQEDDTIPPIYREPYRRTNLEISQDDNYFLFKKL
jgi:hypothetical protein